MKHTELAQDYFERHSVSNECHITSDGRVFHTGGHAISFAQEHDLQDQNIESYTRTQVEVKSEYATVENSDENEPNFKAAIDTSNLDVQLDELGKDDVPDVNVENIQNDDVENKGNDETGKENDLNGFDSPAGQIALDVFLNQNEVEEMKYADLKALVKHFNIETADQKADTLKAALTEYKNNLAQ